ncbi:MAG TPA: metalloregulator ArsR/SmtB family transcription factor [Thermoanaerobaculia bacterium]|nr:metalloregulator ArsR/SmtB family transcription factor [Thermoanaerobaculia bacterium]
MANQSERFGALADPTRREIFEKLARKPLAVGEIAEGLPVTRPAVSQHLKVLKEAGLVTMRTEGTRNVYAIDFRAIAAMRSYLDRFWQKALAAFKDAVEKENGA